jgi:uncharacterized RDD family membrane protein YckC
MAQPRSETPARSSRAHPGTWAAITVILMAAVVATLWVPFYNRTTPELGGFPFFYWYQLLWVPVVALLSWAAYTLTKRVTGTSKGGAPSASVPEPREPGGAS